MGRTILTTREIAKNNRDFEKEIIAKKSSEPTDKYKLILEKTAEERKAEKLKAALEAEIEAALEAEKLEAEIEAALAKSTKKAEVEAEQDLDTELAELEEQMKEMMEKNTKVTVPAKEATENLNVSVSEDFVKLLSEDLNVSVSEDFVKLLSEDLNVSVSEDFVKLGGGGFDDLDLDGFVHLT